MGFLTTLLRPKNQYSKSLPRYRYLEDHLPSYTLPDPLVCLDGEKVTNVHMWKSKRRLEILKLYEKEIYGKPIHFIPNAPFKVIESAEDALNGIAIRKQISIPLTDEPNGPNALILLYIPLHGTAPYPVFVGLNFFGNQTVNKDPKIIFTTSWIRNNAQVKIYNNHANEKSRGKKSSRFPLEYILKQGFAIATAYYGDFYPDKIDGRNQSFLARIPTVDYPPQPDDGEAISTWAWGLSRIQDYLIQDPQIDPKKIIVFGHSRLGKTALWAAAQDERFAMVISNDSGHGGAALFKRQLGESVADLNRVFPHWFCQNFKHYNHHEPQLPVDQHMLMSLIAPRPLYVASATRDLGADPRGEFLSARFASPVYQLFGTKGLEAPDFEYPEIECPILGVIGHHIRDGKHDLTFYDWQQYIKFAKFHFLEGGK